VRHQVLAVVAEQVVQLGLQRRLRAAATA
jgi:hypothetical protein